MRDLSQYSDDELAKIAGQNAPDLSQYSDEDLMKIANTAPSQEGSFLGDMANNFGQGIESAKDLVAGNFELPFYNKQNTPQTQNLAQKMAQGNVAPVDVSKAILEKFGNNPFGKAATAIGGIHPLYNALGTAVNRYVMPAVSEATNISPETLTLAGMLTSFPAFKKSIRTSDPIWNKVTRKGNEKPTTVKAEEKVYDRLKADFPNEGELQKTLNSYFSKPDTALVQAGGERTRNLAEGASLYPSGGAKTTEFFNKAIGAAPDKLKTTLGKTVSPNVNYYDTLDNIVEQGRKDAAPIYKEAFKANASIDSPLINKILNTPEGKSALNEAVKNIQNEMSRVANPDPELTALARELSEIGLMKPQKGGVAKGLKLKTLDYVKKAMDQTIRKAYGARDEAEASRITNLKSSLVSEIDNLDKTGLYAKARKVSGDYLSNRDAMEMGLNFLKDDKEIVKRSYNEFGATEKRSYKSGVIKAIRNNIENRMDGQNVTTIFSRPANREKLSSILSPKEYMKLMADVKATDDIYKLRNQLTGNSRTALRQIASEEFNNEGKQIIVEATQRGIRNVAIDKAIGWISRQFDGLNDKLAKDVANILYETDPKKKHQIVKSLTNQANNESRTLTQKSAAKTLEAYYAIAEKITSAHKMLPFIPASIYPGANDDNTN